ncbi:MAG TPA: pyridoxamine 5'-phosphate oxidase family protein [Candidatus Rubrimentiphilum sp.]|nr:pyridoxamine 5'-phosphate oxidase family protein [Candidatus Rubrimentiphilum sp.]
MIGVLPDDEIERMLSQEFVGRVGCSADGRPYVVPVAYAYHGGCVYSHSAEGLKIRIMRRNPNVCFEVDRVQDEVNWRSVVARGTFEELHGEAAEDAMRLILLKFLPAKIRDPAAELPVTRPGVLEKGAVVYRIRLTERTGRFQESSSPLHGFFQARA